MIDKDTGLYMEEQTLGNFARNTATTLRSSGEISGRRAAKECARALTNLKSRLGPLREGKGFSEAREWFSDNWYLAEREGKDGAMRLAGAGKLPKCAGAKRAVISEAAAALVRSGRGEVTGERIRLFLNEYQKVSVLSERELSVFVPVLKTELVQFLDDILPEKQEAEDEQELAMLLANIFTSIRLLAGIDVSEILEEVNQVEQTLRKDPSGIYPLMDEDTRYSYRREVARIARHERISEYEAARSILRMAGEGKERHVGAYIFTKPLGKNRNIPSGGWYIAVIVLASLFFTVFAGILLDDAVICALLLVPISEIVKNITDFIVLKIVKPRKPARLSLEGGIPNAGRTLCVISALMTTEGDGEKYAKLLEEYKLSNRDAGDNLKFGILADLRESHVLRERDDGTILDGAQRAVEKLNKKYGGGFFLLYRDRELNAADNVYMGRERKRGAIEELVKMLSGKKTSLRVLAGNDAELRGTNFILTLDSDTRLTAGSAREMVGAALHPLNVPLIDEKKGRVVQGYGIFQPRLAVDLKAAGRSDFTRVFAGQGGIDPYNSAVSDVYQDLFDEGTFMGKGLINVPVYERLLDGVFPDNTVLSHDILEGAYIRCAYLSDTELTDGYPYKVTSFLSRQERWTRGDWQNLRWALGRVKDRNGMPVRNNLSAVSRWKIIDNLRRSLVPVMIFVSLTVGMLASGAGFAAAAAIAVTAHLSGLLLTSAELIIKHDGSSRVRYQSTIISGIAGAMMQTAIRLMLLPAEAWTQLYAIVTALYRMFVSHRRMLAWVTASDAERRYGSTLAVNYLKLIACPIAGAAVIMLSPYAAAAAVGLVWIFAPAYAWALSRENRREKHISGIDRGFLLNCAGDIWKYFSEYFTAEDNYLPPDNVQEEPDVGAAHRTSPTNIGLAMLSCVAASDLGLIGERQAVEMVSRTLDTVERLEKWNGHLYNWYDTRTLLPLEPRYVSTVDSGNLAGCLIALRQAFLNMGDSGLAERCLKLSDAIDFRPLFDDRRKLFYIGYDMTKDAPTQGWYDLLASESRMTSFIAIALGQAPRKHWRRLGRALVSQDNFSGMASWTGTMFEYLMPELLLPCFENSLIYESSRFCIYAQKRAHSGMPWGISESAFYAFDPGLSYKYKAHGVQRLALKRGMGLEAVISPYSTFLALPLDARGAVKNLRRMASMGITGRFGFYEAADFTPSRVQNGRFETVRAYMAHHLGMSMISIANVLCGGIFQRRFMQDERMAAFAELLQERVPVGGLVLRQPPRDVPEKPKRAENAGFIESVEGVDAFEPRCLPLSNGTYSVLLTESGKSRSVWQGIDMTRFDTDVIGAGGMAFYLKTADGLMPMTPAPDYDSGVEYAAEFTDVSGRIRARRGSVTAVMTVTVPPSGAGEIRSIEVTASGKTRGDISVLCCFEPVLERREDFMSHPSFSKLSLEATMNSGALILRRRPKNGRRPVFFAVTASEKLRCTTRLRRGFSADAGDFMKTSPDMRVVCEAPLTLTGGSGSVLFSFAPSWNGDDALTAARRHIEQREGQSVSRIGAAALMLGMKTTDVRSAMLKITGILFGTELSERRRELIASGRFKKESLWRYGISGDIPIMAARVENGDQIEGARELIREHAFLTENGIECDLALLITDGGDYMSAQRGAAAELLRRLGRDGSLGARGGVHLIDASDPDSDAVEALCAVFCRLDGLPAAPAHRQHIPLPEPRYTRGTKPPAFKLSSDGTFRLAMCGSLPEAAWSHVLTNRDFGYLATEAGTGFMWYKNSRLMRINRWLGDPDTVAGTERLELCRGGLRESLFAGGDGHPTLVEYSFGYAVWEKELGNIKSRVTAFVPRDEAARVLIVELEGELGGAELSYFTELTLGAENLPARSIVTWRDGNALRARNPDGEYGGTVFSFVPSAEPLTFTCDRDAYLCGDYNGRTGAGMRACAAVRFRAEAKIVIVTGCEEAKRLEALALDAERSLEETKLGWRTLADSIKITTPSENINAYVNGWALYQTVACRVMARTSLYQNGGAVGFRDQLQDVCAVTAFEPEMTASQIRLAAEHQYVEGDVQHWWHSGPTGDRGVRTRCSDDLLWLPYALCDYVEKTGDYGICRVQAQYLVSKPLQENEHDRYEMAQAFPDKDTILNHAMRAADMFLKRGTGEHGLALILSGDWNDGMDAVGKDGRGESVWLSLFGSITLKKLAALCKKEGEPAAAGEYNAAARRLIDACEQAWNGGWYLRGYYDDGSLLGAAGNAECEIDSIAQSFAVLAGAGGERGRAAVLAAYDRLYDREHRLVKLFDPPFDDGDKDPGYIKGYAPGFRENGGQYTHGAVWLAMALLRAGETGRGAELLSAIAPWGRKTEEYAVEPYVISADIYSAAGYEGRGGWSWYTGSAGWYFRAVTEELLGLRVREGILHIEPNLPESWGECRVLIEGADGPLDIGIYPEGVMVNGEPYKKEGYALKIHNKFVSSAGNV